MLPAKVTPMPGALAAAAAPAAPEPKGRRKTAGHDGNWAAESGFAASASLVDLVMPPSPSKKQKRR